VKGWDFLVSLAGVSGAATSFRARARDRTGTGNLTWGVGIRYKEKKQGWATGGTT